MTKENSCRRLREIQNREREVLGRGLTFLGNRVLFFVKNLGKRKLDIDEHPIKGGKDPRKNYDR